MPRRFMILLLISSLIGLLAGCGSDKKSDSDGSVDGRIPAGQFADPNLEACVRSAVNVPDADLTAALLAEIINLECQNMGISRIAGIEHCRNLENIEDLITRATWERARQRAEEVLE